MCIITIVERILSQFVRYLKYLNYSVLFVRNITDIDDKIINRSNENNIPYETLVAEFTDKMHYDFDSLNIKRPSYEPKATDHIELMIKMDNENLEMRTKNLKMLCETQKKTIDKLNSKISRRDKQINNLYNQYLLYLDILYNNKSGLFP